MMKIRSFDEFEGEFINYSDYLAEKISNIPTTEELSKTWDIEDSQKLSQQMIGVKHPWTKDQYEKFTDTKVKEDISYEEYINMWNMKAPDDQKVYPVYKTKNAGTSGNGYIQDGLKKTRTAIKKMVDNSNDIKSKVIDNFVQKYPEPVKEPVGEVSKTGWSSIKLENRIMIIFMIIGTLLSFITVLILMLK